MWNSLCSAPAPPPDSPAPTALRRVCDRVGADDARAATALLVDGTLLLDLTPGPAFAAARAGHSLARRTAGAALASARRAGAGVPGRAARARAGRRRAGARADQRAPGTGRPLDSPGTGYEVTGPDGERLLYLPPGAAPAGLGRAGAAPRDPYDMVLARRARAARRAGPAAGQRGGRAGDGRGRRPPRPRRAAGARAAPAARGGGRAHGGGRDHAGGRRVPRGARRAAAHAGAGRGPVGQVGGGGAAAGGLPRTSSTWPPAARRDGDAEWAERVALHRERRSGVLAHRRDLRPGAAAGRGRARRCSSTAWRCG